MLESLLSNQPFEYKKLSKEEMESRGILGRLIGVIADYTNPTRNGRKYGEELWDTVFENPIMKERIQNKCCFGELGHPSDREETDMEKIAVCLSEQPIKKDGKLYGVFDIINSPCGKVLKSLCDYGCSVGISSRGSGDLVTDFDGNESVDPSTYNCEGWDVVLIPAVKEARLQYVTESLEKKRYNKTLRDKLTESISKESEENQKIMTESLNSLGINLNESLLKYATPYMLRNDGECLECGVMHPYIKSNYEDSCEDNIATLFDKDTPSYQFSLDWYYNNTNQQETKDYLKSFVKSIIMCPDTSIYKDEIDKCVSFDYETNKFTSDFTELCQIYNFLNDSTNQEFCRIRMSDMLFGGNTGDLYCRISSTGFNWFDIIYKLVAENKDTVTSVTICKDGASIGGSNSVYSHKGVAFNHMPTEEFLTLSGNPIIEKLEYQCDLNKHAIDVLSKGGNLSEAFKGMHPRNALAYFSPIQKDYANTYFGKLDEDSSLSKTMNTSLKEEFEQLGYVDTLTSNINGVMDAYQKANKWLDSVKEFLYTDLSCPFFSSYVHKLAHSMPERFDKFGDILHTANIQIPYPATEDLGQQLTSVDEAFTVIFETLDSIKENLNAFIKETDETYHGMACAAEALLNDIESEYPMLYRLRDKWEQCEGNVVEFDKYVMQYVEHKDDLLESLNEYIAKPQRKVPLETRSSHFQIYNGDKYCSDLDGAYVVIPNGLKDSDGITYDAVVACRDATMGNPLIKFKNEKQAQDWIDKYGDNLTFSIHGKNVYATPPTDEESAKRFAELAGFEYEDANESLNESILIESLKEEFEQLGYETTFDESQVENNNEVKGIAVDDDKAVVEELQKALTLNRALDEKVSVLREKLSVSYAKEIKLEEELNSVKDKVKSLSQTTATAKALNEKVNRLQESLSEKETEINKSKKKLNEAVNTQSKETTRLEESIKSKNTQIKVLKEQLSTINNENETLTSSVETLTEQLETTKKDFSQLKEKYSSKIEQQNKLIEKYQRIANTSVNKYIDSQAIRLGVSSNEIKNRLPESYNFTDIDNVCESLQEYKLNVNSLPFNTKNVLNEGVRLTAKNVNEGLVHTNPEDEITDFDLKIAGLI